MSKQRKQQQKKKKREQVRKERLGKYREMLASRGRDDGFTGHIYDLIKKNDYNTAREMLLEYIERYPKISRPYWLLSKVCAALEDAAGEFWVAEQLLEVGERTFEDYMLYRTACLQNEMPATLIACEEQMERRFAFKSKADLAGIHQDMADAFRSDSALLGIDTSPYTDEQLLDLLQRHEKSQVYLGSHRFDLAIRHCDKLIARHPFFRSAYNNKALAVLHDQGPEAAEPFLQQALEHHPDNLYANTFKIRQLAMLGRHEKLPEYCNRLAAIPKILPKQYDFYSTKIEAFAWADDLERIIETYQFALNESAEEEWNTERLSHAQATHCVAVALARLGNRDKAIELWQSIPKGMLEIATENLEDIQKPVGEQNGPWFFSDEHWLPKRFFDMFREEGKRARIDDTTDKEEQEELAHRAIETLFKRAYTVFPSLERTLIDMLKRGGQDSRKWVHLATGHFPMPELQVAVLDYISGQSGTDKCRSDFLMTCSQLNWLPSNTVQIWRKGEESTIRMACMNIYWETEEMRPPLSVAGAEKASEAHDAAMEDGDYEKAIELLTEVDVAEPGRDSIRYNIAAFHLILGNKDIYDEMLDKIVQDFPDYFFGKTALAQRLIKQDRLDEAWDILAPLYELTRLHASEYKALSVAQISYHLAKGEMEVVQAIHQNGVAIIGDAFPSLEHLQRELLRL